MPQMNVEDNQPTVNWVWLILAAILLIVALGAVLYFLSGNGFRMESAKRPGMIQLEQSIHDTGQPVQWVYNHLQLESRAMLVSNV